MRVQKWGWGGLALLGCCLGSCKSSEEEPVEESTEDVGTITLPDEEPPEDPFASDLPLAGILEGVDGRPPENGEGGSLAIDPVLPGDECIGEVSESELIPLEMLIMMDRSVSMGDEEARYLIPGSNGIKWVEVRKGLEEFLRLPITRGLGVGIDYFNQNTCNVRAYSTPEVDIGLLPGVADDILASYDEWSPAGNTPLAQALAGALIAAKRRKAERPANKTIVVLITDGVPHGCNVVPPPENQAEVEEAVDELAGVARAGFEAGLSVPTWVIGIVGQAVVSEEQFRYIVNSTAEAGGGEAVVIEANDSLASEFNSALDTIRRSLGAGISCSHTLPSAPPQGGELDLGKVNVSLEPLGHAPEPVFHVGSRDACEHGGWYYDPPDDPQSIKLCPATCDVVKLVAAAQFQVSFGCDTVTVVR